MTHFVSSKVFEIGLFGLVLFFSFIISPFCYSQAVDVDSSKNGSYEVEVTTHLGEGQTFQEGDRISFYLNLNKSAYLLMLYQDASGQVIQILPNMLASESLYDAGIFMQVPDSKASFDFVVQPSFGNEKVWVFALEKPVNSLSSEVLQGETLASGLKLIDGDINAVMQRIKTLLEKQEVPYGLDDVALTTVAAQSK